MSSSFLRSASALLMMDVNSLLRWLSSITLMPQPCECHQCQNAFPFHVDQSHRYSQGFPRCRGHRDKHAYGCVLKICCQMGYTAGCTSHGCIGKPDTATHWRKQDLGVWHLEVFIRIWRPASASWSMQPSQLPCGERMAMINCQCNSKMPA